MSRSHVTSQARLGRGVERRRGEIIVKLLTEFVMARWRLDHP
jgi:hypothetical protein